MQPSCSVGTDGYSKRTRTTYGIDYRIDGCTRSTFIDKEDVHGDRKMILDQHFPILEKA